MTSNTRPRRAYTIIELLVVMSVIALLAGLLMYFYPIHSFAVLALAGIVFWYLKRRQANAIRRLPD